MGKKFKFGLDYGCGKTNRDPETGIRFGVISQHEVCCYALESFEPEYGEPICPECGSTVIDYDKCVGDDSSYKNYRDSCAEYACEYCKLILDGEHVYPEEACNHSYEADGIIAVMNRDGEITVIKSPYFTRAEFCSPCMPGACYLVNPTFALRQMHFPKSKKSRIRKKWAKKEKNYTLFSVGPRAYCLGADFFPDELPPYPVYSVETGALVTPMGIERGW